MKKLFALFLCLSIMLLTACGNSTDESKTETTTTEAAVVTESHTTELYSGVTTIYERPPVMQRPWRSNGSASTNTGSKIRVYIKPREQNAHGVVLSQSYAFVQAE